MRARVVFDTNTVISAILFPQGRLVWLRNHWSASVCVPLASRATIAEVTRVLAYPKFRLPAEDRVELLGDYLPYCEVIEVADHCPQVCRDSGDQIFLDLAYSGEADVLVTGDSDLLALGDRTRFGIETPEDYRVSISQG